MQDPQINTIFEAGFTCDELTVFVDVLQRNGDSWDVVEIKAATQVKDEFIDDVAVQALAFKLLQKQRAGITVKRFFLMHINNAFVSQGQGEYAGLFVREDITDAVRHHVPFIEQQLAPFGSDLPFPTSDDYFTQQLII